MSPKLPPERFSIWNMFGPTVFVFNDRDAAFHKLASLWGSNGGIYRLLDKGVEIARLDTRAP